MSISRRKFLRTGTLVALATAVPLNSAMAVFGQQPADGNQIDLNPPGIGQDPLSYYTRSTFTQYLNSIFRLSSAATRTVDVTLVEVKDMLPANAKPELGRENFSLLFRGKSTLLPQGTYRVDHAALGTFPLFVVPVGTDDNGAQGNLAIINRLPYSSSGVPPVGTPKITKLTVPATASTPNTAIPAQPSNSPKKTRLWWKRRDGDEFIDSIEQ